MRRGRRRRREGEPEGGNGREGGLGQQELREAGEGKENRAEGEQGGREDFFGGGLLSSTGPLRHTGVCKDKHHGTSSTRYQIEPIT